MELTRAELLVAAERAEQYLLENGYTFIAHTGAGTVLEAVRHLKEHPDAVEAGCPTLAVAVLRKDLTPAGITTAYNDVIRAYAGEKPGIWALYNQHQSQNRALHWGPGRIARRFRQLAGEMAP